jgi:hypothetical protein
MINCSLYAWWSCVALLSLGSVEIIKSPHDTRLYRYVRLENGLEAILVSDPATDKVKNRMDIALAVKLNLSKGCVHDGRASWLKLRSA